MGLLDGKPGAELRALSDDDLTARLETSRGKLGTATRDGFAAHDRLIAEKVRRDQEREAIPDKARSALTGMGVRQLNRISGPALAHVVGGDGPRQRYEALDAELRPLRERRRTLITAKMNGEYQTHDQKLELRALDSKISPLVTEQAVLVGEEAREGAA